MLYFKIVVRSFCVCVGDDDDDDAFVRLVYL